MKRVVSSVFWSLVVISSCTFIWWALFGLPGTWEPTSSFCSPARRPFSWHDLVGTWYAGSPEDSDILVIKADGTYQQIVHHSFASKPPEDYRSPWQEGWIENSSMPVLHLKGWSYCGYNAGVDCHTPATGIYDVCDRNPRQIPADEGLLYIKGTSEITLDLHLLENSWFYFRIRP